jgi:hypothetical protein
MFSDPVPVPVPSPVDASSSSSTKSKRAPSKRATKGEKSSSASTTTLPPLPTVASESTDHKSSDSSSRKAKTARRPRFNPFVPNSYLNLPGYWTFRASQRKSLKNANEQLGMFLSGKGKEYEKVVTKSKEAGKDPAVALAERKKAMENHIQRVEESVNTMEKHRREVCDDTRLLMDLSRHGQVPVDPATMKLLSSTLVESLGVTTSVKGTEDESEHVVE